MGDYTKYSESMTSPDGKRISANKRNSEQVKILRGRPDLNLAVKVGMSPSVHSSDGSPASLRSPGSGRGLGASPKILAQSSSPAAARGQSLSLRNLSVLKLKARKTRLKVRVSKRESVHSLHIEQQTTLSPDGAQTGPRKISLNLDAILADSSQVTQKEPRTSNLKSGKKRKKGLRKSSARKGRQASLARSETSPEGLI